MKNILLTLVFIQTILSTALSQESVQVDFSNYLSAEFEASTCIFTIDNIKMELYDPYSPPYPALRCTPPQELDHIYSAKFDRCDIPLSTTPGTLLVSPFGGCVDFNIRVDYLDGSFEETLNFLFIDESEKNVKSITVTEIECGFVFIYNGQPDPGLGTVTITFEKIDSPFLISPEDKAKDQKIDTLIFDWFVSDENEEYLFQVDTTDRFMNPFFQDVVTGGTDTIYGLEYNRDYYWRVKKNNAYCPDAWSDTFKFSTIIRLDFFQNILEAQNPEDQIIFRDSLLSNFATEIEYVMAADATLAMLVKRNRGVLEIRDFNGVAESGIFTDSTGTDGYKWAKYESPHKYEKDKVIYIDYKHDESETVPGLTIKINIRPTPVIFVHDIFQTATGTWGPIKSALNSNGWGLYIDEMNYSNDIPFTDPNISSFLQMKIDGLLSYIRAGDDFVNKVSLVGHGMGGLVIRNYLKNNTDEENVSRLITLNTPHSGTPMANWILDSGPGLYYWLSRQALKYSGAIDNNGDFPSINNGGLASIRTNSHEILSLNSGNISIPSHSMASNTSVLCQIELANVLSEVFAGNIFEQLIGKKLSVIMKIIENTKALICEDDAPANQLFCVIDNIIIDDNNDGFVGVMSQLGGVSSLNSTIHTNNTFEYLHFNNPNRPQVVEKLKTLLEEDSKGVLFSQDGFDPLIVNSTSFISTSSNNTVLDTLIEISILNIQNQDTICSYQNPYITVEGNNLTNRLMAIYFFENDSIIVDTVHASTFNFNVPFIPTYQGDVNIAIVGTDGSGHYDFDTLSIFIKNSVPIEPNLSISANSISICAGQEVAFIADATNQGLTPTYQWYVNNIPLGNNSPIYSSTSLTEDAIVYCKLTSSADCASPSTVISDTISITVFPSVTPTIDVIASNYSICVGEEITFMTSVSNEGQSPEFQWFLNNNPVGVNSSTFVSSILSNGDEVYCQLTSDAACATPSVVASPTVSISVSQTIEPSLEISALSISICEGDEVEFNAFPSNGGSSPNYQWFVNGMVAGTNSSTYSSSSLSDGAQVYCEMTSSSNCADPMNAISSIITISVNAIAVPEVEIVASATSICTGEEVTFTANPTNGGDVPVYQWFVDGMVVGTNNSSFNTNLLINGSLVTCNLSSSEECANPVDVSSNAISIEVTTLDLPDLAINQDTIYSTNYGSGQFTFEWYLNGVLISNEPFVICQSMGQYELFVSVDNCIVSNTLEVQVCSVGTVDDEIFSSISIFPNPASNTVIIEGREVLGRNFIIRLSNVYGQILDERPISPTGDWFFIELEIGHIPSGNYFVQVVSEQSIRAFKLIKK